MAFIDEKRDGFFKDIIDKYIFTEVCGDGWSGMGDHRYKCFGSAPYYVILMVYEDGFEESAFSFKSYEDLFGYFEDMFADWLINSFDDGFKCWRDLTLRDILGLKEYGHTYKWFEDELKEVFK